MERLDAPECQFVPVTIRLGATDDVEGTIIKFRSDLRNRLNLCRQMSRWWSGVAIWGWIVVEGRGDGFEISAHAIVRIGPLLGRLDVHDAMVSTWGKSDQVEVGSVVCRTDLPALARSTVSRALTGRSS